MPSLRHVVDSIINPTSAAKVMDKVVASRELSRFLLAILMLQSPNFSHEGISKVQRIASKFIANISWQVVA